MKKATSVLNFVLIVVIAVLAGISGFVLGSTRNQSQKDSSVATTTNSLNPAPTWTNILFQSALGTEGNFVQTRTYKYDTGWSPWTQTIKGKSDVTFASVYFPEVENNFVVQSVRGLNDYIYTRTTRNGDTWSRWMMDSTIRIQSKVTMTVCNYNVVQSVVGKDGFVHTRIGYEPAKKTSEWKVSPGVSVLGNVSFSAHVDVSTNKVTLFQTVRDVRNRIMTRSSTNCGESWGNWQMSGYTIDEVTSAMYAFAGQESGLYQFSRAPGNIINMRKFSEDTNAWTQWKKIEGTSVGKINVVGQGVAGGGLDQTMLSTNNTFYTGSGVGVYNESHWVESGKAKFAPSLIKNTDFGKVFQVYVSLSGHAHTRSKPYTSATWSEWEADTSVVLTSAVALSSTTFYKP